MIPKIVHQTSRTKELSWEEKRLKTISQRSMKDWEWKLWDDADNEALIKTIFPRHLDAYRAIKRGVVKADIARCAYMIHEGGFYIDTDYFFRDAPDAQLLKEACILPISRDGNEAAPNFSMRLGNAVFASEQNHPFWRAFLDHLFTLPLHQLQENEIEKVTGPEGLTNFFLAHPELHGGIRLAEREIFHPPVSVLGWHVGGSSRTIGVHMCWGSWRSKGPVGALHLASRKVRAATLALM